MSTPGLMDDYHDPLSCWSDSEASLVDTDSPSTNSLPEIPACEGFPGNIWSEPISESFTPIIPLRKSSLSSCNRNFGSTNLSDLNMSASPSFVQHEEELRSRFRTPHSKLKTQRPYLAFPPMSTQYDDRSPTRQHKSWSEPQTEPHTLQPRASSTSAYYNPPNYNPNRPSNFSTYTNLNSDSDSTPSTSSASPPPLPTSIIANTSSRQAPRPTSTCVPRRHLPILTTPKDTPN